MSGIQWHVCVFRWKFVEQFTSGVGFLMNGSGIFDLSELFTVMRIDGGFSLKCMSPFGSILGVHFGGPFWGSIFLGVLFFGGPFCWGSILLGVHFVGGPFCWGSII